MHLSDHDPRQLDEAYVGTFSQEQAQALLIKALGGSEDGTQTP